MSERRFYTADDDSYIMEHYHTTTDRNIALHLERTIKSVRKRAKKLGLEAKKINRRWTPEEDEIILNRDERELRDVAKQLGRDMSDTSKRAILLGKPFRKIRYHNKSGYQQKRVPNGDGTRKTIWKHIEIMKGIIGRSLLPGELVHHIDCDKGNNEPDNLWLCESSGKHGIAHRSVEKLLPELIRNGIVYFDRKEGVYRLCERETGRHHVV